MGIALGGLARTWRESRAAEIPRRVGELLNLSPEEAEKRLEELE